MHSIFNSLFTIYNKMTWIQIIDKKYYLKKISLTFFNIYHFWLLWFFHVRFLPDGSLTS